MYSPNVIEEAPQKAISLTVGSNELDVQPPGNRYNKRLEHLWYVGDDSKDSDVFNGAFGCREMDQPATVPHGTL